MEGLMSALSDLTSKTEAIYGIPCPLSCEEAVLVHDKAVATQLYYIAQEAVHNAVKHAKPPRINVQLAEIDQVISLKVSDEGIGFDRKAVLAGEGLGLKIMQHRARLIGASLSIKSAPSSGAIIKCSAPNIAGLGSGKGEPRGGSHELQAS